MTKETEKTGDFSPMFERGYWSVPPVNGFPENPDKGIISVVTDEQIQNFLSQREIHADSGDVIIQNTANQSKLSAS